MASTPETTPEVIKGALAAFGASDSCYLGLSLQKFNGGFQYQDTFIGLSVDKINSIGAEKGLVARKILPFASDEESLLCLQFGDDASENVIIFDPSDDTVMENLQMNYGQYLESIRGKLLTSQLVYESGLGLVSVA